MKLKYIVDALNHYYLKKFPNAKGWFIGKETLEPAKVNAYKKYNADLYKKYGNDNYSLIKHYLKYGRKEGRKCTP